MWGRGRVIPGNTTPQIVLVARPDAMSTMLAGSMAIANNTVSPMAAGRHTSGTQRGFSGLPGYGVHRFAGRTGPMQYFAGAAAPAVTPSTRLGLGAGVAGQPGLPQTGQDSSSLAWLGYRPGGYPGIGG